jgi:hypothetical protein
MKWLDLEFNFKHYAANYMSIKIGSPTPTIQCLELTLLPCQHNIIISHINKESKNLNDGWNLFIIKRAVSETNGPKCNITVFLISAQWDHLWGHSATIISRMVVRMMTARGGKKN